MAESLRIAGVVNESSVAGKGLRFVVFCQGCPHHCPGCHNPQTHDFEGGYDIDIQKIVEEVKKNPLLQGVTFSGGEPFCQAGAFAALGKALKDIRGMHLNLTAYTGYTYEERLKRAEEDTGVGELLKVCDYLIDGPFILDQRDLSLKYRGSRNQRYIDLNRSRVKKQVVLAQEDETLRPREL